jgi:hypothetical protein
MKAPSEMTPGVETPVKGWGKEKPWVHDPRGTYSSSVRLLKILGDEDLR